ncbi:MAG TPA: aminotransferase class IV [Anaerolineaceae bacterium]|nr:aminotransferase class IV [Anaerolineaceae bacterium]HPN50858.1 aminotransferase class IV [Anaerolineaceae bacterium]
MIFTWMIDETGEISEVTSLNLQNLTNLDEVTRRLPQGAYTTFRTYEGNGVLRFKDHLARLSETAELMGKPMRIMENRVRNGLGAFFKLNNGGEDFRIRLTLDLSQNPGALFLSSEPLECLPDSFYENGVKVITSSLHRENPRAKATQFIEKAMDEKKSLPEGVNEAIMVDEDGFLLEGLSSNFFAVLRDAVWTANDRVLSGITRRIVLEEVDKAGIQLHLTPVQKKDLPGCTEAFITSTSRAVLPVVEIDDLMIGNKKPGPVTKLLLDRYQKRVRAELDWL